MLLRIPRLYDSHTHFLATGQQVAGLNLSSLSSLSELAALALKPSYWQQDWLVGFGWSDSWLEGSLPLNKENLDRLFPDHPVFLSRQDGHSSFLNSLALQKLGLQSSTGRLQEKEHMQAWDNLPALSTEQMKEHLLAAVGVFNRAGFSHIRDMSCTDQQWQALTLLENQKALTLAVEENFTCYSLQDFPSMLASALYAKKHESPLLRAQGMKIFFDGSLGSETAFISQPYRGVPGGSQGKTLWSLEDFEEVLIKTWEQGLELSVHTIGDQAAHWIVQRARQVAARGNLGRLNLEHVEILRPETIQMMKGLHARCYLQPCHWLEDRLWLKEKVGELYSYAFPWESLRTAQIPFFFGCDSPIVPPSFFANQRALKESAKSGIRAFRGDILQHHSHPDSSFADSLTIFEGEQLQEIRFLDRVLK